jgi:hypothetical protein
VLTFRALMSADHPDKKTHDEGDPAKDTREPAELHG